MSRKGASFAVVAGLLVVLALFLAGSLAGADDADKRFLYQWTDDRGNAHISDSLEKVPPKYRSRARTLEQGVGEDGGQDLPAVEQPEYRPMEGIGWEENDEIRRAEWQQRMYDAKQRMADAENRLRHNEEQLKALQEKTGYGLYGYTPEAEAEAARLESEIARAQVDLANARREVEVSIPEEARKAGVPPGWLREVQ
jgi:hypothetical protein